MSKYQSQIHEHDDRWTAIDNYALAHLHPPTATDPPHDVLEYALENSTKNDLPDIAVSALQGKFLLLQGRLIGVKNILEVGTLGGYSTIWLANTSPDVRVTTIEVNEHHAEVARQNFKAAGVADRVEVVVGPGVEVLPKIAAEVEAGTRPRFGLTFIDADKDNNWFYFDLAVKISYPRSVIFVDNVVRRGTTADAEAAKHDPKIQGSRVVIENAGKDSRVDSVVLQTVGEKSYDGFLMAVVKD